MGNANSLSTEAFESSFSRLLSENVSLLDDEFWNGIFAASVPDEVIKTHVTFERIRVLKEEQKVNCCTLLKKILAVCRRTADEGQFVDAPLKPASIAAAETAVRLLTRVIPVFLEVQDDAFANDLLWKPGSYVPSVQREFRKQLSQVTPDAATGGSGTPAQEELVLADDESVVLAKELLTVLQRLLFVRGYSVGSHVPVLGKGQDLPKHRLEPEFLWCGGIMSAPGTIPAASNEQMGRRVDILQCLIVCFSSPLFASLSEYPEAFPQWMSAFVSGELPFTATLFCSLIATIFSYDPVGYALPFGSAFSNDRGAHHRLVEISLQFLCLVMDVDPATFGQSGEKKKTQSSRQAETSRNVYRTMLSGLNKDAEIGMIFDGILKLLSTVLNSASSTVRSIFPIEFDQELLTFFWLLLNCNPNFLKRICSRPFNSNLLLQPLLFILLEGSNRRKELADTPTVAGAHRDNTGVLHVIAFILLLLSSEREFAIRLNDVYVGKFPLKLPLFQGCHADLMLLVMHRVCVDTSVVGGADSLIDMLLTAFCNVSAYVKSFCMESAVKLLSLVERFSRPVWLFAVPYRVHQVAFLLDSINNLIQYQFEGNTRLVYAILRQRQLFFSIQEMALPSASVDHAESDSSTTLPGPEDNSTVPRLTLSWGGGRDEQSPDQWRPTSEWLKAWKSKLQLHAITRLINNLYPKVEHECREKGLIDQGSVLEFLQGTTLVGILPVPHPIVIRNYQANSYTTSWWTAFGWGVVFSRNHLPKHSVDTTLIRLVRNSVVKQEQSVQ